VTKVSVRNCCWEVMISNMAVVRRASLKRLYRGLRMTVVSLHAWRCPCVMGVLVASRRHTGMIAIRAFGLLAIRSVGLWVDWRRLRDCGLHVGFVAIRDRDRWIWCTLGIWEGRLIGAM
jgi:hypothetical protein